MFLSDEQLSLEPLFGSEERLLMAAAPQAGAQAGAANGYIDIVQPLPGQPSQIFLRFPGNVFRVFNNPNPQTHDEVQEAFAFGHQVIGVWDSGSPQILRSIQIRKL